MSRLFSHKQPPVCDERLSHIAFIMDGNGRWAKRRGMPRSVGHAKGAAVFKSMTRWCKDIGIRYMTVDAFSTENWKRPAEEVEAIMGLLSDYMQEAEKLAEEENASIRFIGNLSRLSHDLMMRAKEIEEHTAQNTDFTLLIALSYGGRDEITHAVNSLIKEGKTTVTEQDISSHLYTSDIPDPDLVVRTGGEVRTSNFLLWQSAYAEYIFSPRLWPDLTKEELYKMIREFYKRRRRFGGV
ncbi:MAG: di-trans,poly-cis-decaprenylcistransferase [Clostridia bacterium]|nr:di-trans,poly-cis-decaprenylcistransferase [Clostridia bacterium]